MEALFFRELLNGCLKVLRNFLQHDKSFVRTHFSAKYCEQNIHDIVNIRQQATYLLDINVATCLFCGVGMISCFSICPSQCVNTIQPHVCLLGGKVVVYP